jgi:hypothetical protein
MDGSKYLVVDEEVLHNRLNEIDSHLRYISVGQVILALTILSAALAMVLK